jgi:hypothetical protein
VVSDIHAPSSSPRAASAFLRLLWMAAPAFAVLCILVITGSPTWTLGRADLALVLLIVTAVVARTLDGLRYGGTTARNEPATRSNVLGYAARIVLLAGVAWCIAQSVTL